MPQAADAAGIPNAPSIAQARSAIAECLDRPERSPPIRRALQSDAACRAA